MLTRCRFGVVSSLKSLPLPDPLWPLGRSGGRLPNLSAAEAGSSLPSLSVPGLSIATFTTSELGSKFGVAKTVREALKDGSLQTLSGNVWGSTPKS